MILTTTSLKNTVRDWHMAMNQFMIIHGERLKNYL